MVYQQKFIAVIKSNGKILREQGENTVYLPFNTEYEIFIKNLESRDASVNITIDGQDILDGNSIILRANSSTVLEGFLKDYKTTHKFKFIQKTEQISNYRGDRVDDGLIRIEYRFTKIKQTSITHYREHFYHPEWCDCYICRPWKIQPLIVNPIVFTPPIYYSTITSGPGYASSGGLNNNITRSINNSTPTVNMSSPLTGGSLGANSLGASPVPDVPVRITDDSVVPNQDEGITVKGSRSNQRFSDARVFELEEQSYAIILKLRGHFEKQDKPVTKPVSVSTKLQCSTCGKKSDSKHKFCPECGTALY